ncbi:DUF4815 domain-containing protein [Rugamonas sp. CCM 8940]|uniref:DUF4815 domain-containing protein n=1 Tax=Rugamonas sp. CCM 8940 TaxID=2765359 RepID=UPI0018F32CF7|nr:DUF4815 domain-containing protein [Rugamonas sp. CCM 8940]MBJ7309221.1 DUF4815 domain-containing protein [Rugamonas sp. CCM 8940]
MIEQYYNRFNAADNHEQIMFRADRVLQSAELNEIQSAAMARLQGVSDALFKDGDIIRDARVRINPDTGASVCEAGAIYIRGAVRGLAARELKVATVGSATIGVYLKDSVVTELEVAELRNPAAGTRGYQEPGAARQKTLAVWGVAGDGQSGEFYPVYLIDDGVLRAKEAPPNLDGVTQALARYDRDSSGGSYVVGGLNVAASADVNGAQVYTVSEGRARVNGFGVNLATSRRPVYAAKPDLRNIELEPHVSSGPAPQRVTLDRVPLASLAAVHITLQKSATMTRGGYTGGADNLADSSIVQIVAVNQGGTINANGDGFVGGTSYVAGTSYKLTAGAIDWGLPGTEPATNSTYQVIYQCNVAVTPTLIDDTGFTVTGAVNGTQVLVNYSQKLPRVDRLCLDADGALVWIKGVAADVNPRAPAVPDALLALASVQQSWRAPRVVQNDGVRVVPMQDLANINARMDFMATLIAQQTLKTDAANRDTALKKGIFVDPFLNDGVRDQGVAQSAAIVAGKLTLPVTATPNAPGGDVKAPASLKFTLATVLSQPMRTTTMKVNPYAAFDGLPASVTLTPAIDRWTDVDTTWSSPLTTRIVTGGGALVNTTSSTVNNLLSTSSQALEKLRQIPVSFAISGFGPNEALDSVSFDGIVVTPTP